MPIGPRDLQQQFSLPAGIDYDDDEEEYEDDEDEEESDSVFTSDEKAETTKPTVDATTSEQGHWVGSRPSGTHFSIIRGLRVTGAQSLYDKTFWLENYGLH